jgi:hypothetical protein
MSRLEKKEAQSYYLIAFCSLSMTSNERPVPIATDSVRTGETLRRKHMLRDVGRRVAVAVILSGIILGGKEHKRKRHSFCCVFTGDSVLRRRRPENGAYWPVILGGMSISLANMPHSPAGGAVKLNHP